ncbi:MAG TPA: AAA family ATPase, partial [Burkholderiaceae bacterium]
MYAQFFGLKQKPFSIAPDPRYLFMSERHREALAHLLYGVQGGGGFVLLTGEIGAGKTTVCRCFLEQIPQRCNVAYIFNPKLTVMELLATVCHEFGIPVPALTAAGTPTTVKDYVDALNQYLLRTHSVGQNNLLIIDEAQNLAPEVLEQLRLLTNLETSERKLLQIVLIGQPELREMLARPELEQLAQRVIARFHLEALSAKETAQYIAHRLAVAGLKGALPFDAAAIARIHQLTRGVPRRINLLCDRALLGGYASGRSRVDRAIVDKAALEVFGPRAVAGGMPGARPWRPLA